MDEQIFKFILNQTLSAVAGLDDQPDQEGLEKSIREAIANMPDVEKSNWLKFLQRV